MKKVKCEHHGLQYVTNRMQSREGNEMITHDVLACGCTAETVAEDFYENGDVVRWDGELYIVIGKSGASIDIKNVNGKWSVPAAEAEFIGADTLTGMGSPLTARKNFVVGDSVVHIPSGSYGVIHEQKFSGTWYVKVNYGDIQKLFLWHESDLKKFEEPTSYAPTRNSGWDVPSYSPSSKSSRSMTEPSKKISISTAELIQDEVDKLNKSPNSSSPSIKPISRTKPKVDDLEPVKIKKRKGKW